MAAITTFQVVDCNKELAGLGWRVRLHDACGRQTLTLERCGADGGAKPARGDASAAREARETASSFFARTGTPVEFADDDRTFWPQEG